MPTKQIIKGILITFTGREDKFTSYKRSRFRYVEILCIFCNEPKWAGYYNLLRGIGFKHKSCSSLNMWLNKKLSVEAAAIRDLFIVYTRTNNPKIAQSKKWLHEIREFKLSLHQFSKLILSPCYYCGGFTNKRAKGNNQPIKINGIDRLNNNIGYVPENCVPCCIICNRAKQQLSYNDFMKWIRRLCNYNSNIKSVKVA